MLWWLFVASFLLCSLPAHSDSRSQVFQHLARALPQQFSLDLPAGIIRSQFIPPQYLLRLVGDGVSRHVQELIWQKAERLVLEQTVDASVEDRNRILDAIRHNLKLEHLLQIPSSEQTIWEGMIVSSFNYDLRGEPRFYLDPEYGVHVVIAVQEEEFVYGFSVLTPWQRHDFDFTDEGGAVADAELSFRGIVFTPRHYVFWGDSRVHVLGRESKELEFTGQVAFQPDEKEKLVLDLQVQRVERVNDEMVAAIYKSGKREAIQLISLSSLTTVRHMEIAGKLLAISAQGDKLVSAENNILAVINVATGEKQVYTAIDPVAVQFSPDGKHLGYVSGDNDLHLVDLQNSHVKTAEISTSDRNVIVSPPPQNIALHFGDHDLYLVHGQKLLKLDTAGKVVYRLDFQDAPQDLRHVDDGYLAVFFPQQVLILAQNSGEVVAQIQVDSKQQIKDWAFATRYLSLLLEDRLHHVDFSLTLAQIPLVKLLDLISASSLLRDIALAEPFIPAKDKTKFSDLILGAVDSYLQHNPDWHDSVRLLHLFLALVDAHIIGSGNDFRIFPHLVAYMKEHKAELEILLAANPQAEELAGFCCATTRMLSPSSISSPR